MSHMLQKHGQSRKGIVQRAQNVLQVQQRTIAFSVATPFDPKKFWILLLKWIICTHVSFSEVEHPQFRELLTYCNGVLEDILPRSHNTIRDWILKDFEVQKTYL